MRVPNQPRQRLFMCACPFAPSGQINLKKQLNRKEYKEHKGFQNPVLAVGFT